MDNGDCYELQVRKLTKKQQRECTNFYGGRGLKDFFIKGEI